MPVRRPRLLILNASLAGATGNTAVLLTRAHRLLARYATVERLTLSTFSVSQNAVGVPLLSAALSPPLLAALTRADGFLFGTGTHWDSWSSVLQKFLEAATPTEATAVWLGKPAAVLVTEHSTGGKSVLSRLQGVLVTLGCSIPPMSGLVLSRAARLAVQHTPDPTMSRDFWCEADLRVVCHNLAAAARFSVSVSVAGASQPVAPLHPPRWRTWPVDRRDFNARWIE